MAGNSDPQATWTFHNASKYVAVRDAQGDEQFMMGTPPAVQNAIWQEDWSIEPFPFKIYETLDPIALPREELPPLTMPALDAIAARGDEPAGAVLPDLAALARICLLSNGILKRGSHRPGGQEIVYRAAGGTGARYHLELYIACGDLDGLSAGVYHYSADDHSFRQLRAGDHRAALVEATGDEPNIAAAPAVLLMTSTFWRNAWRYKARAYRHTFWDAGTTFANILAVAAGDGLPATLVLGYADAPVNALLDIDGEREAVVALCAIGRAKGQGLRAEGVDHHSALSPQPLALSFRPPSAREVVFPEIGPMHRASELATGAEAAEWRANPLRRALPEPRGPLIPLRPLPPEQVTPDPIDRVIRRRRSTRHFAAETPISFEAFSTLLERATRGVAADCLAPGALPQPLHDEYLIVNNVAELEQGVYVLHPDRRAIELLKAGDFRQQAQRLAVQQQYAAEAHVNLYCLTDLNLVLEHYGNRGYRLAQLEGALYASKLHLATHALGLGAVGSTSFDDEVIDFFAPHAAGKSYMFVLTFGLKRRRT
jgi:SagB-type dehydrogenase family enzyme